MFDTSTYLHQEENEDTPIVSESALAPTTKKKVKKSNFNLIELARRFELFGKNLNLTLSVGVFLIAIFFYSGSWGDGETKKEVVKVQPTEQSLPEFDSTVTTSGEYDQLSQQQLQLIAFFKEEDQNELVQLALAFQNAATNYTQSLEHICTGQSVQFCLETFKESRIKTLRLMSSDNPPAFDYASGNARLDRIHQLAIAEQELKAINLAIAMSKPIDTRSKSEQEFINQFAPRLLSGVAETDLKQRPLTLISLLEKEQQLKNNIEGLKTENKIKLDDCLAKSEEEQKQIGGCFK